MRRDEVVAALRQAKRDRQELLRLQARLAPVEKALDSLSREERKLVLLVVNQRKGDVDRLCEELEIERSAVYRRRDKALQKLGERL